MDGWITTQSSNLSTTQEVTCYVMARVTINETGGYYQYVKGQEVISKSTKLATF